MRQKGIDFLPHGYFVTFFYTNINNNFSNIQTSKYKSLPDKPLQISELNTVKHETYEMIANLTSQNQNIFRF